jgi:putative (di)nucleoside polyphosphate hydrolase
MGEKFPEQETSIVGEFLRDSIVRMLMRADNVDEHELGAMLDRITAELATNSADAASADQTEADPSASPPGEYRRGVGIVLLNDEVFVGQRIDVKEAAWQMPQGGIEDGETPRDAAFRELREEIGTDNAEILAESKGWHQYDLPPAMIRQARHGHWSGQQQKWFVMRFMGRDTDIDVATEHPEFSRWRWVPIDELTNLIVPFKRRLYLDVLKEFRAIRPSGYNIDL